jgi:hypothetical protein
MVFENETRFGIPEDGVDTAALTITQGMSGSVVRGCTIDGGLANVGLRVLGAFDLIFEDCVISGGVERALDIDRGGSIIFRRCRFDRGNSRPTTRQAKTLAKTCDIGIKGGARDVTFESCMMNDVMLGDYSIYNQVKWPKTRGVTLKDCVNWNEWPILIRMWDAEKPILVNTEADHFKAPASLVKTYFQYNVYFGDKRSLKSEQFKLTPQDIG